MNVAVNIILTYAGLLPSGGRWGQTRPAGAKQQAREGGSHHQEQVVAEQAGEDSSTEAKPPQAETAFVDAAAASRRVEAGREGGASSRKSGLLAAHSRPRDVEEEDRLGILPERRTSARQSKRGGRENASATTLCPAANARGGRSAVLKAGTRKLAEPREPKRRTERASVSQAEDHQLPSLLAEESHGESSADQGQR